MRKIKGTIIALLVVLFSSINVYAANTVSISIPIVSDSNSITVEENGVKKDVTGKELHLEYDKVGNYEYSIYADGYENRYSLNVFVGTKEDGSLYTESVLTTDSKTKVDEITFKKSESKIEKPNTEEPKKEIKKGTDQIGTGVVDNPVMWGAIITLVLSLLYLSKGDKKC